MKRIGVLIVASLLTVGGLFILLHRPEKDDAPELLRHSVGVLPEQTLSTEARVSSSVIASLLGTAFQANDTQSMASVGADARAEVTQVQVADIFEAAADGGSSQLEFVYAQFSNAQPEIREEALNAVIQFVGREAIPRLKQIAAATENTDEKAHILEAIEFLELPTFSEQRVVRAATQQSAVAISNVHPRKSNPFFKSRQQRGAHNFKNPEQP